MPALPDHQHYVRRVVLPSGKTVEVVYFEDLAVPAQAITARPAPSELHICGSCRSELVHPVDWEEAGAKHWDVALRCPECGWERSGIFSQEAVDLLDEQLDLGMVTLVGDLRRLSHANMEDEIERFVTALGADLIVPGDF